MAIVEKRLPLIKFTDSLDKMSLSSSSDLKYQSFLYWSSEKSQFLHFSWPFFVNNSPTKHVVNLKAVSKNDARNSASNSLKPKTLLINQWNRRNLPFLCVNFWGFTRFRIKLNNFAARWLYLMGSYKLITM